MLRQGQTLISFFWPAQNAELLEAAQGQGRDRHRDGHGAPHQPRAEDGRAVVDGQHRGLPRGDRGREQLRPLLHRPGDGGGQGAPGQGAGRRRGRGGSCGDRHGDVAWVPSSMPSTCAPKWPSRSSRWARTSSSSNSRRRRTGPRPGGYAAPSSPEFREKQLAKFRELAPEMDIVITTALIPGRPAPKLWTEDMVADDEAGLGHRRPCGRAWRQLRPDRARPEDRDRQRRDHRRLHRFPQPDGRAGLDALFHQHPPHADGPDAEEGWRDRPQHGG